MKMAVIDIASISGIIYDTMKEPLIVIDTNVLVAALKSSKGASFQLLSSLGDGEFGICLSTPLVLEYEDVAKRVARSCGLRHSDIDDILDYLCSIGRHRVVHYLWRPHLRDPSDDMLLELAVEASAKFIVTHNQRDFQGSESFGIQIVTPSQFLEILGGA